MQIDSVVETRGVQVAAGAAGAVITQGHVLLDTVLPKGKGDRHIDGKGLDLCHCLCVVQSLDTFFFLIQGKITGYIS